MNKYYALSLLFATAGSMSATEVSATDIVTIAKKGKPAFSRKADKAALAAALQKTFQSKSVSRYAKAAPAADNSPVASHVAPSWGFLTGADGKQWYYTQTFTEDNGFYKQSAITIYDSSHNQLGVVTVDVPEGYNVNQIAPYGNITKKLFDKDDTTNELTVQLHKVGNADNNYQDQYYTYVYHIQDGSKVKEYDGQGMLVDASQSEWETYQRLILIRQETEGEGEEAKYYTDFDIIRPASWGEDEPQVEHTFKTDDDLTNYVNNSPLTPYVVDGSMYYVTTEYEKPYVSGYDDNFDIVPTENNKFVVTVYDKDYTEVEKLSLPIEKADDALYRFATFASLGYEDLSKNVFSTDGTLDVIVGWSDYITATDADRYRFDVYDSKGNMLKTVCDNVYDVWQQLLPIEGKSDQMMFLQTIGDAQQIRMVNVPECESAALFPAEIDGEAITTNINRYPDGKGSYLYAVKMGAAASDDEGNIIGRIGWYTPDVKLDHYASFNLGQKGELFNPNLADNVLNPYLFNTDDSLEYLYLAKIKRDDSEVIDNVLTVASEDGKTIKTSRGDDNNRLYSAIVLTENTTSPEMAVVYLNQTNDEYKMEFYSLPFTKFVKGGDGTKEAPYLISTVGDMLQINSDPKAFYKLADDIDMAKYPTAWTPLNEFMGSFDGDNHVIKNLNVDTKEAYAGLFASLGAGSTVKNLTLYAPQLKAGADNSTVGVIAGTAITDTLSNVHVYDANIEDPTGESSAIAGGLIGQSSLNGVIESCSFDGKISMPGAQSVGGIVGDIRTNTDVKASSAKGSYTAKAVLGGVVGSTNADADVTDSHADVTLTAENNIGGIVGSNDGRGLIERCVAQGSLTATTAPMWGGFNLGGIAGSLATDWEQANAENADKEYTPVVSKNLSTMNITSPQAESEDGEKDQTVHRIIGKSIINEDWYEGETPVAEKALAENYAAETVTVDSKTVAESDAKGTEGETAKTDKLKQDFFSALGYAYGSETAKPWKGEDVPQLYFENVAQAISLSQTETNVEEGTSTDIYVEVFGADASTAEATSADPTIASVEVLPGDDDNTAVIKVTGNKEGQTVVTAKAGSLSVSCTVTVSPSTGLNDVETVSSLSIKVENGSVKAAGAATMSVFDINGQKVAGAKGDAVSTSSLHSGVYVVTATDNAGHTATGKILIK